MQLGMQIVNFEIRPTAVLVEDHILKIHILAMQLGAITRSAIKISSAACHSDPRNSLVAISIRD
jgi:hypothetical protein